VPEFQTVHTLAIEAEYQLGKRSNPSFNAMFPPFAPSKPDSTAQTDKKKGKEHKYFCAWHQGSNSHATKDCRKIASLKAAGKWKSKESSELNTEQ
jgi:hypothetical protein